VKPRLEAGHHQIDSFVWSAPLGIDLEVGVGFLELPEDDVNALFVDRIRPLPVALEAGLETRGNEDEPNGTERPKPRLPLPAVERAVNERDRVRGSLVDSLGQLLVGPTREVVGVKETNRTIPLLESAANAGRDGGLSGTRRPADDDDHARR